MYSCCKVKYELTVTVILARVVIVFATCPLGIFARVSITIELDISSFCGKMPPVKLWLSYYEGRRIS